MYTLYLGRQEYLKEKRILVVDDDPDLCDLLQYELTRAGAEVCTAADGHEALRQFDSVRPDLVILDIMMPGLDGWEMDGWETCRQIRCLTNVPIMMLSALDREHDILRGLDLGADDYVTKPCSAKVLVARTRAALRRAQMSSHTKDLASYTDGYLTVDSGSLQISGVNCRMALPWAKHNCYIIAGNVRSIMETRQ